jgi:hypothetical protein
MQIHELTTHKISRTDEGFMDTLKSIKNTPYGRAIDNIGKSVGDAKQAVGQTVQNVSNRIPTPVKRAAGAVASGVSNVAGTVGSAIVNPTATAQTLKTAYKNPMTAIKAAVSGTSGLSFQQKMAGVQTTQAVQQLAKKFQQAWQNYSVQWAKSQGGVYTAPGRRPPAAQQPTTQPTTQSTQQAVPEGVSGGTITPEAYEDALKAFVQKNMLSGMQYSSLQNAQQIDGLITAIVDPQNDTPAAQNKLWNQLALAASVAQKTPGGYNPSAVVPTTPTSQTGQSAQATPSATNAARELNSILSGVGITASARQLAMLGKAMQQDSGITEIHSNGDPLMDALLKMMGYRVT